MRISRRLFIAGAAGVGVLGVSAFTTSVYTVDGIAVHRYQPTVSNGKPPIIMIHGGAHAAWVWERWAPYFADQGWDCHVIDWYNHGQSTALPTSDFILRGITDLHREILSVSRQFFSFHLMGHSMGALAALRSSTLLYPSSVTLISPVVPSQVGAAVIPIPVDLTQLYPVPPFATAKSMFYSTMTDTEAQTHYARLQPESSQAVWEATRWTVSVNLAAVTAPVLAVGAGSDTLTPPQYVQTLAGLVSGTYLQYANIGHSDVLLKASGWQPVATDVENWLDAV